jgi:hypothetical protein
MSSPASRSCRVVEHDLIDGLRPKIFLVGVGAESGASARRSRSHPEQSQAAEHSPGASTVEPGWASGSGRAYSSSAKTAPAPRRPFTETMAGGQRERGTRMRSCRGLRPRSSETWHNSDAGTRGRAIAFTRHIIGAMAGAGPARLLATRLALSRRDVTFGRHSARPGRPGAARSHSRKRSLADDVATASWSEVVQQALMPAFAE